MLLTNSQLQTPLTGELLLTRVEELAELSREQKAKHCGYSTFSEDGVERIDVLKFMVALLAAKGIDIELDDHDSAFGGWSGSYRAMVQPDGTISLDAGYLAMLDLKPGDELEIALGRDNIQLIPMSQSDSDEDLDEDSDEGDDGVRSLLVACAV